MQFKEYQESIMLLLMNLVNYERGTTLFNYIQMNQSNIAFSGICLVHFR